MKKLKFLSCGFLVGATFSVFASMLFALLAVAIFFGIRVNDPFQSLVMIGYAGLYSVAFAFLPGGMGGAYLANWLFASERTDSEITHHGLFVGALTGLLASLTCIAILFRFLVDWMTFGFVILATVIASMTSLLAARWLAKKKSKFTQQQT